MSFTKPIQQAWKKARKFVQKRLITRSTEQAILNTDNIVKVLVIGETGSGKSTFINYLTNYFGEGNLENLRVAIPSQYHPEPTEEFEWNERSVADNTQSQTDDCHQYIFVQRQTNKQYLFVDSPGLGDTRGTDQDVINMDKIIDAVESLGNLTAVIIVVNGSVCREHLVIRNVVARLKGYLPNAVMKQVIVVLTNAKRHEATFDLKLLHLHGIVYPYYMQNAAFCSDPDEWDESTMNTLQVDWNQSMEELAAIIDTIDSFKATSVKQFTEMKQIRNDLKTLMHTARLQVIEIQRMQDEIAMFEEALKQAKEGTVAFSNYSTHRTVEKVEIADAPYHSTLCQNCNHVCHDQCHLDETSIVGAQLFKRCKAMDDSGTCTECRHRCSYTAHYHAKATVKITQETLEDVIADIKAKYDKASNDKITYEYEIETKSGAKTLLEKALEQKNEEIRRYCLELKRICPGFNLTSELSAFIDMLRVEASLLRNTSAREKANEFIHSLKLFCDKIECDQKSTSIILPEMVVMDTRRQHQPEINSIRNDVQPIFVSPPSKTNHVDQSVMDLIKQLNLSSNNDKTSGTAKQIPETTTTGLHQKETTQKPTHSEVIPLTAEDLIRLTNKELITQYEDEKTSRSVSKLIFAELIRRSQGKTTGPIFAASDVVTLSEYSQKYREFDNTALTVLLHNLQNQVNEIVDSNIARLVEVDSSILLEMCAVQAVLSKKIKDDKKSSEVDSNRHRDATKMKSKTSRIPRRVESVERRNHQQHVNDPHDHDRSPCSPVILTDCQSDSDQLENDDASSIKSTTSTFTTTSKSTIKLASGTTLPRVFRHGNNNSDDLRSFSDTHLIKDYHMSVASGNRTHQHAVYNELERRCYGDHPLLIVQEKNLFDEILSLHSSKSTEELGKLQQSVRKTIDLSLGDAGATQIHTLPHQYIIEAAVLTKLLTEEP